MYSDRFPSSFSNITANGTNVVKSQAGILRRIVINTKGATGNTLTIYDNTSASGTKIGTIDTTVSPGAINFECNFSTGLTVVTATGTCADVTVVYS